jgi:hypothetical protein
MSDLTRYWVHDDSLFTEVELRPFPEGVGKVVYLADAVEARLAEVERKYNLVCDDAGYRRCCDLRVKAEEQLAQAEARLALYASCNCCGKPIEEDCAFIKCPDCDAQTCEKLGAYQRQLAQAQAENNRLTMENVLLKVRYRGAEAAVQFLTDKEAP